MTTRTVSSEHIRTDLRDLLDALTADSDMQIVIERYRKPVAVMLSFDKCQALLAIAEHSKATQTA